MPWVRQWHGEIDPAFGRSPAEGHDAYLTSERESRHLTEDALRTRTGQFESLINDVSGCDQECRT